MKSHAVSVFFSALLFHALAFSPSPAKAEAAREFIMSCTYGVLAGTLVGGASLAFSDKPGDNLNKVARGASIGLYAGILLGAYVVYGVPVDNNSDDVAANRSVLPEPPRLLFEPILTHERGLEGGLARLTAVRF